MLRVFQNSACTFISPNHCGRAMITKNVHNFMVIIPYRKTIFAPQAEGRNIIIAPKLSHYEFRKVFKVISLVTLSQRVTVIFLELP